MVNEMFARAFWKDLNPIGRGVSPRFGDATPWVTVVGVAKVVKPPHAAARGGLHLRHGVVSGDRARTRNWNPDGAQRGS
jgi:hypothetical protein